MMPIESIRPGADYLFNIVAPAESSRGSSGQPLYPNYGQPQPPPPVRRHRRPDSRTSTTSSTRKSPTWIHSEEQDYEANKIVTGKVLEIRGDDVVIDIGYKSEGVIKIDEWKEDGVDTPAAQGRRHRRGAARNRRERRRHHRSSPTARPSGRRSGTRSSPSTRKATSSPASVLKKIKGGLLVNIGVNVFLPASQVDIRRPQSIDEYIDKNIECVILKIDEQRRNIVVSRRKLIEDRRRIQKDKLLSELEVGQIRKGVVKNIAEFGAFVDLGGIDGLLHITDMGWHRVTNPRDVVQIDQELEVYILHIDREKEKIALSLKHKTPSPWQNIEAKYPIGSRHQGEVVNIMPYGAFVKLEPGIEGLVHISEMSWVKRIADPKELVQIGDKVEVQVLNINHDKKEISLGHEAVPVEPVGRGGQEVPAGHGHHRHGAEPHQLRRVHRDRGGDRRPPARQRHELRAQGVEPVRDGAEGPEDHLRRAHRSTRSASAWRWASSRWARTRGRATSPAASSPARRPAARSPSSPTSACSSNWSRASKGCSTSPSFRTTRSRARRRWSRSATRWT